jgi:hypothetical protein
MKLSKEYMEIRTDYNLDATIEKYSKILMDRFVIKFYPRLENVVWSYKNILMKSSRYIDRVCSDFFEIPITTGTNNDYYYLNWSVDLINNYVNENVDTSVDVPIGTNHIFSCDSRLNPNKLEYYKSINKIERPIVLAFHLPINKWLVIDGNHRYHVAKHKKDNTIKAILLYPNIHWEFLVNDISRKLYTIHHNLHFLQNFSHYPLRFNSKSSSSLDKLGFNHSFNEYVNFRLDKNMVMYIYQMMNKASA